MNTKLNIESIIDGSIEKVKLAESVQESLNKADSAMQSTDVETLLEDFVHKDSAINFANDLTGVVEATPEMFTYRPSAGDKSVRDESAMIRRIKGNTSVWSQYVRNGNFAEGTLYSTGVNSTISNNGDGSINIVNNGSGSDGISQQFASSIPARHKVLIVMDYKRSSTTVSNVLFYLTKYGTGIYDKSFIYEVSSDSRRVDSAILETTNDTDMILLYPFIKGAAGEYVTMYSYMAIDLTALFGVGNEPTTYEEFCQYYPDIYYPYCLPTIRSMRATGIETVGFNAFNGKYAEVIGGQTYYLGVTIDTAHFTTDIGGEMTEITIPENRLYTPSENGYIYATGSDICINLSHSGVRNGEYKPYEKNTLLLPEIAKYFPNGMHGIGDVFDEINEEMAIQRCAVRAYEEGDENNAEVKTDKITTVYKLSVPIYTPIDEPLQLAYKVDDFGTEKMLSDAPSSPFKADIVYQFNAEGRIRDNSRNIERLENKLINKQDKLTSGTNIKFINGESVLGDGNLVIDGNTIFVANDLDKQSQLLNTTIKQYGELIESKYVKSETGIPATDLSEEVQTSLGKADNSVRLTTGGGDINPGYNGDKQFYIQKVNGVPTLKIEMLTNGDVKSGKYTRNNGNSPFVGADIVYDLYSELVDRKEEKFTYILEFSLGELILNNKCTCDNAGLVNAINNRNLILVKDEFVNGVPVIKATFDSTTKIITFSYFGDSNNFYKFSYKYDPDNNINNNTLPIDSMSVGINKEMLSTNLVNELKPYVLSFSLENLNTIATSQIEINITELYNVIRNHQPIIIKNSTIDYGGVLVSGLIENLDDGETAHINLSIYTSTGFWKINGLVFDRTDQGQQTYTITGSNVTKYFLPNLSSGSANLIAKSNLKTINGNSIYKEHTVSGNIYTYYPLYNIFKPSMVISPNIFYKFGTPESPLSGTIDIKLGAEISSNVVNEYIFEIYTNTEVVPTLSLSLSDGTSDIKWVSGNAPVLEENKIYQISIINKLGTVLSWDNA